MDCPVCKEAMITLELDEVEIDYCGECSGIWLDAGELEMLLDDGGKAKKLLDSFSQAKKVKEKHRRCPICLKKMLKIFVGDEAEGKGRLLIDKCPAGHGLWFDRGELRDIISLVSFDQEHRVVKLLRDMFCNECESDASTDEEGNTMIVNKQIYGKTRDGEDIYLFRMENENGVAAQVTNYGAILVSVETPDRDGKGADVTLGFDTLEGWMEQNGPYFGATVGRVANRIAKGKFTLEGQEYELAVNNGPNHLHGGIKGFDKVVWDAEEVTKENEASVRFEYTSADGEEGYPGNLTVSVTYTLNNENELVVAYEGRTDKATPVNMTNHTYWNLAGHDAGDICGHQLVMHANMYTELDEDNVPTGKVKPVNGTALDFTSPHKIGERIDAIGGYDHNVVLNKAPGEMGLVAEVYEPGSGRTMRVYTTQPGMQLYTAEFLDGSVKGKGGAAYGPRSAFCLETQHYPDSVNHEEFPSTVIRPGEVYKEKTVFKFGTKM
ncbi:Aldose 1-epimerase precursor [Anaerohalosphaera lusitana]|uniref:Aldose 1-epimerase n=1 Tax=Anaerohalosphaera lusitana TaxID=1936003 RepID=A0A1U9NN49_9BACT|nr:galactose-1-epimerase [Anaerohalosphaera lusitana]AQT69329.1 Aldose 1-epimerase precursor [Anaerohalosphaera lusitana]